VDGFHGLSYEYMRSPRFLRASGGWGRIVWIPSDVKEKLKDFIPADMYDEIATEKDVTSVDELVVFLRAHHHPILARTTSAEPSSSEIGGTIIDSKREFQEGHSSLPGPGAGVSITFHNIRLHADRVFVRKGRK
jgi:acetyl-CoA decarbonylase/synthase complex subunit beta